MMELEIEIDSNLEDKIRALSAGDDQVAALVEDAMLTSAIAIQEGARQIVPVMTGKLRESIIADDTVIDDGDSKVISVGSNLVYAPVQEFTERPHPLVEMSKTGKIRGNTNPEATWGFLRKSLYLEQPVFIDKLQQIVAAFGIGGTQ